MLEPGRPSPRVRGLQPLRLLPGYWTPFSRTPHKVAIVRARYGQAAGAVIELRGWRCKTHEPLRFAYGGHPTPGVRHLRLRPYPTDADKLGYTGYMLFSAAGDWRLEASANGNLLGRLVLHL